MNVFCLSADQVEGCWNDFAWLIERFERVCGDITTVQIRESALASKQQIWGLQDEERVHAIMVTEIASTAQGLVCRLIAAVGTAPEPDKRRLLDTISAWAREIGCVFIRFSGRKGWLRWDRRFKQTGITAEISLCP